MEILQLHPNMVTVSDLSELKYINSLDIYLLFEQIYTKAGLNSQLLYLNTPLYNKSIELVDGRYINNKIFDYALNKIDFTQVSQTFTKTIPLGLSSVDLHGFIQVWQRLDKNRRNISYLLLTAASAKIISLSEK